MTNWIISNGPEVLAALGAVVAAASAIAALTPNKTDDKVVSYLRRAVNFFALGSK